MRPNIWIRQMTWSIKYGIWLGKKRKQARIIKLLQNERLKHIPWCGKQDCPMCEQTIGIEKAIALIQGEEE